jgi:hypothetical protein
MTRLTPFRIKLLAHFLDFFFFLAGYLPGVPTPIPKVRMRLKFFIFYTALEARFIYSPLTLL